MWRVKVCGLTSIEDADFAREEGADALGFVLEPTSPRCLRDWSVLTYPFPDVRKVAVFAEFIAGEDLSPFDLAQGFGADPTGSNAWMPVFRPSAGQPVEEWLTATAGWEWCLLDPFKPGVGGGTGERIDWDSAAQYVKEFTGNVILAGGLNDKNVAEAIERVRPYGVDASSGLERSPGEKDETLVAGYVAEAWRALRAVHGDALEN